MTAIRNMNDGTQAAPYLRPDFNFGGLTDLPDWSRGPRGLDARGTLAAIKAAGYRGTQGGDPALSRELGLGCNGGGRVDRPEDAAGLAAKWKQAGFAAVTVHVARGHESDAEVDALVRAIVQASRNEDLPIY